ncbi:MAG TPA: apolipoprotein N-acyltransferase [Rhodospirillales bacterium]|nr:apolipoprotein N-acyltransferase [Rhodospirillales bacterium]
MGTAPATVGGWGLRARNVAARLQPIRAAIAGSVGWKRIALAVGLGVVAVAALPPFYVWVALFVAFTGLVWLIDGARSAAAAFLTGWWFGLGHFVAGLYWIAHALLTKPDEFGWLAPIAPLALSALMAIFPAAAAAATKLSRAGGVGRVLVFAAAWALFEWVRSWAFSGFPWNLIGSVWTFSDAMMQSAAYIGTYGLGLLTLAAAAMPAVLVPGGRPGDSGAGLRPLVAALTVLALVWVGGAVRLGLAGTTETVPDVRLRLVQPNIPQEEKWKPELRGRHFLSQLRMGSLPGDPPPTHVIWAEAAAPFFLAETPEALALLAEATPERGLTIVGTLRRSVPGEPHEVWNSLLAVDHSGRVAASYDKSHLVPFGEYVPFRSILGLSSVAAGTTDFSAGAGIATLSLPGLPEVSPLICYEVIFPAEVVDPGRHPRWLLNLTNDGWYGHSPGPYQHFAAARLRAVEEGLPLVRVANTGISAIVDPYGRVVDQLPLGAQGLIDGALPAALTSATLYGRFGNLIVFLLIVLVAAAGVVVGRQRSLT